MKLVITTLWLALASTAVLAEAEQTSTSALAVEQNVVSTEQKSQIKALVEAGTTRKDAREQVLSKEQIANMSRHRAAAGARGESILGQLGLSEEQKANISKIRADGGTRKDVRGTLTAEQAGKYDELRRAQKANKDKKKDKEGKKDKESKKDKEYKARDE
jgi:hypothetical protein